MKTEPSAEIEVKAEPPGMKATEPNYFGTGESTPGRSVVRPLFWIRFWLALFIASLVISGVTAIPLTQELSVLYRGLHYFGIFNGVVHDWIQEVFAALLDTKARYPFLYYGTDWLAFGHFVIAVAFIGPLRDPLKNVWVVQFGIIACLMVIPYALIFGALRDIPWWWRAIDCSFGLFGLVPLCIARRLIRQLESPL